MRHPLAGVAPAGTGRDPTVLIAAPRPRDATASVRDVRRFTERLRQAIRGRSTRRRGDGQREREHAAYPGDFTGTPELSYEPKPDGLPDPGEIVWTWVPYEEDHGRGKDRPVLVIGRDEPWLLALMLTSKDHDRDAEDEARYGRFWVDIGSGAWDGRGRPSEVRVDRVLRVDPGAVRREGAVLDRDRFQLVVDAVRARS